MFNTERELTPSWSLVRPSVELVKENYETVLIVVLLPALLTDFGSLTLANSQLTGLTIIGIGVFWRLINLPVSYYLQTKAASGKSPTLAECYRRGLPFGLKIIAFEIFFFIITVIGLILLIVPGLIIFRRYYLTPFYIVKSGLPIDAAMHASAEDTRPVSGFVWGTVGVIVAFSFLALFVSLIRYLGPILAALVSLIYFFGPALRWREISRSAGRTLA